VCIHIYIDFDVYFNISKRIRAARVKTDGVSSRFYIYFAVNCVFTSCLFGPGVSDTGRGGGRRQKVSVFPVKLIRFFVRSISCRRRASPGTARLYTVPQQPAAASSTCCGGPLFSRPHSRGLPVINFTSLKSRDFRNARAAFYFYLFFAFRAAAARVIKRTVFKPARGQVPRRVRRCGVRTMKNENPRALYNAVCTQPRDNESSRNNVVRIDK